jgi:monofunctional chorismate mutase
VVELEGIQELRKEIDKIDDEIIDLLKRRLEIARKIGKIKKERHLPVLDKEREKEVLERAGMFQDVFKGIIGLSKKEQFKG